MEKIDEFHQWIDKMLRDAKKELKVSDITIAFILMGVASDYYIKAKVKEICYEDK